MIRITTTAVLALAGTALAQPAITIDVENPVLRPGESTLVTMYAGFDPSDHAMASVVTDFQSSSGSEGLSDAMLLDPMDGPGTLAGSPSATGYDTIVAGQLHFPLPGIYADPSNPVTFWRVTYTAPVDISSPFDVELLTRTSRYDIYLSREVTRSESRLADLTEGSATIRVIPAPASALVLAGGVLLMRRRR